MVQELDSIVLLSDLPEHGLSANDVGTVVHVYNNNAAYEVEFVALNGQTIAVATIPAAQVRPVRPLEVAQVRQLVAA